MSAQFVLAAAQYGMQLFGAAQDAIVADKAARVRNEIEKRQIRLQSEAQARSRNMQMFEVLGAQTAALASSGIGGGRTSRLLRAQTRRRASMQREYADIQTASQIAASDFREDQTQLRSRQRFFDTLMGGGIDLLSAGQGLGQQTQAIQGPGGSTGGSGGGAGAIPSNPGRSPVGPVPGY